MKKMILMLVMMFALTSCQSQENKVITFDKLPSKAKSFIKSNFSNMNILQIVKDNELFDKEYVVYFTEGSKIEFNKKGDWEDIEIKTGVPKSILNASINNFITKNHQNTKVVDINKDKRDYEVKLDNSIEIVFNLNGDFLRYDD